MCVFILVCFDSPFCYLFLMYFKTSALERGWECISVSYKVVMCLCNVRSCALDCVVLAPPLFSKASNMVLIVLKRLGYYFLDPIAMFINGMS